MGTVTSTPHTQPDAIGGEDRRWYSLTAPLRRQLGWIVWGIGAGVYVLAVFHRTSLGVAGPLAEARFSLNSAQLGTFVMLQLGVYALMQVPTGIMVDRFGPRKMLLAATTTMGLAQIAFALVDTYPLALLARGVLGCGDAMTYISVLRLAAAWFPARRYAVLTAFTGLLGSVGNLIATVPLTALLAHVGWTPTFLVAGALSLGYGLLLLRSATRNPLREAAKVTADSPVAGHRIFAEVRQAWRVPAGRLGFWVHLTTMTGPVVFSVLWGYPYMTDALGYDPSLASSLLMIFVLVGCVASLTIGVVVGRRPVTRTPIAVAVALACLLCWIVLVGWPAGRPPIGVVVTAIVILAVGGPASSVAFFLARDYNPRHRISTATGMVNVGGFAGTVVGIYLVGQILDLVDSGAEQRSVTAFRWAFAALAVLTAFGITRMITWWLRTRAEVLLADARGEDVPVRITAHRWELVDTVLLAREAAEARAAAQDAGVVQEAGAVQHADIGPGGGGDRVPAGDNGPAAGPPAEAAGAPGDEDAR